MRVVVVRVSHVWGAVAVCVAQGADAGRAQGGVGGEALDHFGGVGAGQADVVVAAPALVLQEAPATRQLRCAVAVDGAASVRRGLGPELGDGFRSETPRETAT